MTCTTLFLAATIFLDSSAIVTATTIAIIVWLVFCKDVHIFKDTASGHAVMADEIIEQVVHLQVELEVVI